MDDRAPDPRRAPTPGRRARLSAVTLVAAVATSFGPTRAPARADDRHATPPTCPEAPPADLWVRDRHAAFVAVWRDRLPGPAGEGRIIRQVASFLSAHADFSTFARRALGPSWEVADEPRRGRWASLLRNGLERRYLDQVRSPLGASVTVEAVRGDCEGTVVTIAVRHRLQRDVHTFDLVLGWDGSAWRAVDAIVDEASLLEHYRARFRRIHAAGGVDAVDTYLVSFGTPAPD